MPTKIKVIWYLCIVISVIGFLYLAAKGQMEEAVRAEEMADKRSQARLEQLKNPKGKKQIIKIDPIKAIREMKCLGEISGSS